MNTLLLEKTSPTIEQFQSLQEAHDYFNQKLFNGKLSPCFLNFSRRQQAHGFFVGQCWSNDSGTQVHEISLNPDTLNRPIKEVMATLVHEMAHQWQAEFGKPSRNNYHNKQWASKMEFIGLIPSSTGKPGGKRTGNGMSHYIQENGRFDLAFRQIPKEYLIPWKAQPLHYRQAKAKARRDKCKYSCPSCQLNVWGKFGLQISCDDCHVKLRLL